MDQQTVPTNDIQLHVVQDGPADGPLVMLLHGFPEFWYGWRKQIPHLAEAGFRVWAADQRGYNKSDKPEGTAAYNLDELAADIAGLIKASGREQVHLVGHDWGGAVAWWVAAKYPELLSKLVILNVPHGAVLQRNLRRNRAQLRKSWYFFAYQIPWLPERIVRLRNWRMGVNALLNSSRPGTFSEDELDQYRHAWSKPDAFKSMLNWYRAMIWHAPQPPASRTLSVPTLIIWGARDKFFERSLAQESVERCDNGRLVFLEEATHWLHHEEPERVNELIVDFLQSSS